MSPARRAAPKHRLLRAIVVVTPLFLFLVLALFVPLACAPDPALVAAGGECFAATDCEPGLVCVPQRGGARACSSDLSQIVGRPPAEAGAADTGGGDGPDEVGSPDAPGQDTSLPDTSMPDTSVADAAEAG